MGGVVERAVLPSGRDVWGPFTDGESVGCEILVMEFNTSIDLFTRATQSFGSWMMLCRKVDRFEEHGIAFASNPETYSSFILGTWRFNAQRPTIHTTPNQTAKVHPLIRTLPNRSQHHHNHHSSNIFFHESSSCSSGSSECACRTTSSAFSIGPPAKAICFNTYPQHYPS